RNAEQIGAVTGRPLLASTPGLTVIVWYVSTAQCPTGTMVTVVLSSLQCSSTAVGGSTTRAASTEARCIGVENPIVAAASSSTPVPTDVRNAAWVSGTMSLSGVAVVSAGRP